MSVAFRRESDEEHKEPVFELPLPAGPNLVTARGLALTAGQVETLEAALTAETEEAGRTTLSRKLRYWRTRLATAQLAPPPPVDEAGFGSRVTIDMAGRRRTIDVVGDDEADPAEDRLAFSAPLARALIGTGAGDRISFGGKAIEVVAIAAIPD